MAFAEGSQWPLTAAATHVLLELPASSAPKGGSAPAPKDAVKLALKELILRGAYEIRIEKRRLRQDKVTLWPGQAANLPERLAQFDFWLRPHTPNVIGKVIKGACQRNDTLIKDVGDSFFEEIVARGLVEQVHDKVLGLFPRTRWRRTASGDAWAASAAEHVARMEALETEAEQAPSPRPQPSQWRARWC